MIQKPFRGTQLNRMHPLAKGLVGCWIFNEATGETVFDLSGNGNNGTLENGTAWGNGGLKFDGVGDYVDCGSGSSLNITDSISFSAWIFPESLTGVHFLIERRTGTGSDNPYAIYTTENKFALWRYDGTNGAEQQSTIALNINQWNYVALSADGTNVIFNVNGTKETHAYTQLGATSLTGNSYIGRSTAPNPSERYFNGSINFVRIYNRALSAEEIAWLYREPYAMFEPAFNPALLYSAAPPVGAIMNQFQKANIGADLYNGVFT